MNNSFIETVNARKRTQRECGTQPVRLHRGLHEMLKQTEPDKTITSQINTLVGKEVTKRWTLRAEEMNRPVLSEAEMYEHAKKLVTENKEEETNDSPNQGI